jgi:hypothetical protein
MSGITFAGSAVAQKLTAEVEGLAVADGLAFLSFPHSAARYKGSVVEKGGAKDWRSRLLVRYSVLCLTLFLLWVACSEAQGVEFRVGEMWRMEWMP